MTPTYRRSTIILTSLVGLILCLYAATPAHPEGLTRVRINTAESEKLIVTAGRSVIVESPVPVKRVSLAAPSVADAVVLTRQQIYVSGKAPGVTNLTLWNEADKVFSVFDLQVTPDIARLKAKLYEMLPKERDVRVMSDNETITVAGTVSSPGVMAQVLAAAQPYAPLDKEGKSKIVNLIQVGGVHQVMLEVRVSEMNRTLGRQMGINFNGIGAAGRQFGVSVLDRLTTTGSLQGLPVEQVLPKSGDLLTLIPRTAGFPVSNLGVSDQVNGILRFLGGGTTWTVAIDALKDQGIVKVLAEPTLITLSGRSASFLAGGEYPIPVPQAVAGGTTITIQYKPFGVGLNFTPTVLDNGKIGMEVAPEVSELDFSAAVVLQGYVVPSITTRRVATTVELGDGQSFAIAGLLKDETRESIRKFPLLGDIPILGALFRSSSYQKNETELVIVVTPHLVKPMDTTKQTLPTDQFIEPDDLDFYLLGRIEGRSERPIDKRVELRPDPLIKEAGLEGDFGHIMP